MTALSLGCLPMPEEARPLPEEAIKVFQDKRVRFFSFPFSMGKRSDAPSPRWGSPSLWIEDKGVLMELQTWETMRAYNIAGLAEALAALDTPMPFSFKDIKNAWLGAGLTLGSSDPQDDVQTMALQVFPDGYMIATCNPLELLSKTNVYYFLIRHLALETQEKNPFALLIEDALSEAPVLDTRFFVQSVAAVFVNPAHTAHAMMQEKARVARLVAAWVDRTAVLMDPPLRTAPWAPPSMHKMALAMAR